MKRISVFLLIFLFLCPIANAGIVKNIDVPFTSQAPDGWYSPFDEACEESSTVMLDNFYRGKNSINNPKQEILEIVHIENQLWGYNKDTNAHQMTHIINNYFPFEADIKENPSVLAIQHEIDNNRPVLIPVYGRGLDNPNFIGAGPIYHVVIIKGYDDNTKQFITNEPGTRHGHNWRYGYDEIINAIHDFNQENQQAGKKVAIFTHDDIRHSGWSDADKDGYSKFEEMKNGTSLKSNNTNQNTGASLYEGKLLRSHSDTKVYLIQNGKKRHIRSAEKLFALGYSWADLTFIDQSILNSISPGNDL